MRTNAGRIVLWSAMWMICLALADVVHARDRSGTWQGTLDTGDVEMLLELKLSKADDGRWDVTAYSAEKFPQGIRAASVTLADPVLKFSFVAGSEHSYDGIFADDQDVVSGTFARGQRSWPLTFKRVSGKSVQSLDTASHAVQRVTVAPGVQLEVLDWGGGGRPVIFLPGLSSTAHIFDELAPKLTARYHVYGMTRRGFGNSSAPPAVRYNANGNYSADRLGDDVLAVIDALELDRPVLVGHSIAGTELSSVGSRYPERIGGLIYLDAIAGYSYAPVALPSMRFKPQSPVLEPTTPTKAIQSGEQQYTKLPCPLLALLAVPHRMQDPQARERDRERMTRTADTLQAGVPCARVVRLADAEHAVWVTHEADVLREIETFLSSLPITPAAPRSATQLSGTWKGIATDSRRSFSREIRLQLEVAGETVTGTLTGGPPNGSEQPLVNGRLSGNQLSFEIDFEFDGKKFKTTYRAEVTGNQLKGTHTIAGPRGPAEPAPMIWEATKQ